MGCIDRVDRSALIRYTNKDPQDTSDQTDQLSGLRIDQGRHPILLVLSMTYLIKLQARRSNKVRIIR